MADHYIHIGKFNEICYDALEVFEAIEDVGKKFGIDKVRLSSTSSCRDDVDFLKVEEKISYTLSYSGHITGRPYLWFVPSYADCGISEESVSIYRLFLYVEVFFMKKKLTVKHDFSCFIEKLRCLAISDRRLDIRFSIEDKEVRRIENLALVILCPDNKARCKWTDDICSCNTEYNGERIKNKKLRPATYYDYLWRESVYMDSPGRFDDDVKWRFKEEGINITQDMIEKARCEVKSFMEWLAIELSKAYVTDRQIFERLGVKLTEE